jgi:molybdopterin molybdotransferase
MSMLSVEEALGRVLALVQGLGAETVPVGQAHGRALAQAVAGRRALPPWDNSAMDGYAVRSDDVRHVPARLAVRETIFAGKAPAKAVQPGTCARIMTGARMPQGADAVVMQERTTQQGEIVEILEGVASGTNVRLRGEDVKEGAPLLAAGTRLGVAEVALLQAQGLEAVPVAARPTVAIASSGDELVPVGQDPGEGIIDTNTPVLAELTRRAGGVPVMLGLARDELAHLEATFKPGLDCDVLIAVAGASVGERDYTREALEHLGVHLDFWKVAMRPGKPLSVGRAGKTLVFGLPGNPISAMVTFELFVRPALLAMQGLAAGQPALTVPLGAPLKKPAGLRLFVRARLETRATGTVVVPTGTQSSGALTSATLATHLISLAPELTQVAEGQAVTVIPVSWAG